MPNEAARLVDELTTLLYEVIKRWQLPDGRVCEIVRCGACRRKADRAESVVHDSDCPVYRLIRAEEANTAVIRANAEEIADLEDKRDELEAKVNALTAQMECRNELTARLDALLAERDAWQALAEDRDARLTQANRNTTTMTKAAHDYKAERDALRARAERAESALRFYEDETITYLQGALAELADMDAPTLEMRGYAFAELSASTERVRAALAAASEGE